MKELDSAAFALGVKLIRRRHDLTQRDLGEKAGINWRTVHRLENGGGVNLETAISLANALGSSMEELMKWGAATGGGENAPD